MKDLASRFSEVERRVTALLAQNRFLRRRVRELERERDAMVVQVRDGEGLRERTVQVRDRLQRLLARLEAVERETGEQNSEDGGIDER